MVAHQGEGEWVSIAAAARRLGVSRQAIQKRIARGKIDHRQDNMGNPQVRVAAPSPHLVPGVTPRTDAGTMTAVSEITQAPQEAADPVSLSACLEMVERLQAGHAAALAAVRVQVEQWRTDMMVERGRHDAEIERLIGQVHAERSFWIERADAAECRAEAAEQRMVEIMKRPWWRRWLG